MLPVIVTPKRALSYNSHMLKFVQHVRIIPTKIHRDNPLMFSYRGWWCAFRAPLGKRDFSHTKRF